MSFHEHFDRNLSLDAFFLVKVGTRKYCLWLLRQNTCQKIQQLPAVARDFLHVLLKNIWMTFSGPPKQNAAAKLSMLGISVDLG